MVEAKRLITNILFVILLICLFVPVTNAQEVRTVKLKPYYRESVVNVPSDKVIKILTNYGKYNRLFQIKETKIHAQNSIHTIVSYKVKIGWKEPAALLRFTEKEYGNVFQIDCESIRLYDMKALDGQLKIYSLPHGRTKLKIRAHIKPDIYLPNMIYQNTMDRMFDKAIKNLIKIAKSIRIR
jgi:hypothetical protein